MYHRPVLRLVIGRQCFGHLSGVGHGMSFRVVVGYEERRTLKEHGIGDSVVLEEKRGNEDEE